MLKKRIVILKTKDLAQGDPENKGLSWIDPENKGLNFAGTVKATERERKESCGMALAGSRAVRFSPLFQV